MNSICQLEWKLFNYLKWSYGAFTQQQLDAFVTFTDDQRTLTGLWHSLQQLVDIFMS